MLITVPTMVNIRLRVCASVRSEVPELQHFPNVMDPDTKQHGIPFAEATALLYRLKSPPRMANGGLKPNCLCLSSMADYKFLVST